MKKVVYICASTLFFISMPVKADADLARLLIELATFVHEQGKTAEAIVEARTRYQEACKQASDAYNDDVRCKILKENLDRHVASLNDQINGHKALRCLLGMDFIGSRQRLMLSNAQNLIGPFLEAPITADEVGTRLRWVRTIIATIHAFFNMRQIVVVLRPFDHWHAHRNHAQTYQSMTTISQFLTLLDELMLYGFSKKRIIPYLCRIATIIYLHKTRSIHQTVPRNNDPLITFDASKLTVERTALSLSGNPNECTICFEGFGSPTVIAKTQCNHLYHEECLIAWAIKNPTCPMCRSQIIDEKTTLYPPSIINPPATT